MATTGLPGCRGPAEGVEFGCQQRPARLRSELRTVGGVGAVGGAEGVHHVDIAQGGVLLARSSLSFFALIEANVFEQYDFAVGHFNAAEVVFDQARPWAQRGAQVLGYGFIEEASCTRLLPDARWTSA